jgi:alanine racemase
MDQTVVDVTDIAGVAAGDEAVLIGEQGGEKITADDLADLQKTIAYEVLCDIGARVPRVMVE